GGGGGTCVGHVTGEPAVGWFARMLVAGGIERGGGAVRVSATGEAGRARLGIDLGEVRRRRRQFACACPDWSERKPHLGGALGAALLEACLRQGWLRPQDGSRALQVSSKGRAGLRGLAERTAG
ncbi:transcriptional regulator, partial [Pseudomonas aeruginosa]